MQPQDPEIHITMKSILTLLFCFLTTVTFCQLEPVTWNFDAEKINDSEYEITLTAKMDRGWSVYSQETSADGPIPTSISIDEQSSLELIGKTKEEGVKKSGMDEVFGVNVVKYTGRTKFKQRVKVTDDTEFVSGTVTYMTCNGEECLPPTDVNFEINLQ